MEESSMPLFIRAVVKKRKKKNFNTIQCAFVAVGLDTVSFLRGVMKTHK